MSKKPSRIYVLYVLGLRRVGATVFWIAPETFTAPCLATAARVEMPGPLWPYWTDSYWSNGSWCDGATAHSVLLYWMCGVPTLRKNGCSLAAARRLKIFCRYYPTRLSHYEAVALSLVSEKVHRAPSRPVRAQCRRAVRTRMNSTGAARSAHAPAELGGVEEQAALPKPMARCKNVEAA
jgi:hypothetical protein